MRRKGRRRGSQRERKGREREMTRRRNPKRVAPPPTQSHARADPLCDPHGMEDRVPLRRLDVGTIVFVKATTRARIVTSYL